MFSDLPLRKKLITAFVCFIVVPAIVLGTVFTQISSKVIKETAEKSAVQNSEQIIKNLDTFLGMIIKLSEYPISDAEIRSILAKDYTKVENPVYERKKDFAKVNNFLYEKINSFSNAIDSSVLYRMDGWDISGRSPTDYVNSAYNPSAEDWFKEIIDKEGAGHIVGIHRDYQMSAKEDYVISIGRLIKDPYSKEDLGVIVINVKAENLEHLWMDTKSTSGSRFYLIDEKSRIIYSDFSNELDIDIHEVLNDNEKFSNKSIKTQTISGMTNYLISSVSGISSWTGITIIPKEQLLSYKQYMWRITFISTFLVIILSIIAAVWIATSITGPLNQLNEKMRQVGAGNLDIDIDIRGGEVGEISMTAQKMLNEIKNLIRRIYEQEAEKREVEMLALQSQINPHFLYNTINVIKWMAHMQGVTGIENALENLTSLLYYTFRKEGDFVSIKEEMQFIEDYIAILNLRYYNKFAIEYDIQEEVYQYLTLKFLLQPIIENAVFHGFEGLKERGLIYISIYKWEDQIIFKIQDNGVGMEKEDIESILQKNEEKRKNRFNSIGIPNINKRLKLHFGETHGLSIRSEKGWGTLVTIATPAIKFDERTNGGDI